MATKTQKEGPLYLLVGLVLIGLLIMALTLEAENPSALHDASGMEAVGLVRTAGPPASQDVGGG
jgi:hypothetical protein